MSRMTGMDAMEEDQPFELEVLCLSSLVSPIHSSSTAPTERLVLQAYASNYASHAKVDRLLFIASSKQGTAFGEDALQLALEELSLVHKRHAGLAKSLSFAVFHASMFCRATTHKDIRRWLRGLAAMLLIGRYLAHQFPRCSTASTCMHSLHLSVLWYAGHK